MSAPTYEYKTVALPQTVQGKRKRGVSEADLVASTFGEVIHLEAIDGWEYMRSDILAAGTRGGMFSKEPMLTYYTVLVFRRTMESAWPMHREAAQDSPQSQPDPQLRSQPRKQPAPAPAPTQTPAPTPAPPRRAPGPVIDASPPTPMPSAPVRPKPAPVAPRDPLPAARAIAPVPPSPSPAPSGIADPTSPLAQGMMLSTGGQFGADGMPLPEAPSPVTKPSPRPPLGSAQD